MADKQFVTLKGFDEYGEPKEQVVQVLNFTEEAEMAEASAVLKAAGYDIDETIPTLPFSVGDVVQLNSGGPLMTVVEIISFQTVLTVWFDQKGDQQSDSYPAEALVLKKSSPAEDMTSAP